MILWLDAQLSPALAHWITAQFAPIKAVPVRELGLRDADDHVISVQGPPPQVIWPRVGNSSNEALQAVLLRTLEQAVASLGEGESWVEIRSPS